MRSRKSKTFEEVPRHRLRGRRWIHTTRHGIKRGINPIMIFSPEFHMRERRRKGELWHMFLSERVDRDAVEGLSDLPDL
ncbi:hypothetical protein, partial [uncultured Methanofollis sp.]|uniref:hypothetical protein n=1 Tax=uncultured Methanofollis sp. TaxID=262500 RepID=UPI0026302E17